MKNQVSKLIAVCAIVCGFALSANAQNVPAVPATPAAPATPATLTGEQMAKMTPEQRVEMRLNKMKSSLNLTDAQTAQVKTLLMSEVTARASGDKQKAMAAREKTSAEMSKILTPEQLTKYTQMTSGGKMHLGETQLAK